MDSTQLNRPDPRLRQQWARRAFLGRSALGLGATALSQLLPAAAAAGEESPSPARQGRHYPAKAKRIIYLLMHGGPSQIELFDYKPGLAQRHATNLPDSVRGDQRLTGMTSSQEQHLVVSAESFRFRQHGQSGTWVSDALPHLAQQVVDICVVRSMTTEAINHDPAVTLLQTGHQQPGRPSLGAWLDYGLGSENENLPSFVVMISQGSAARPADPLYARLWGSGFLPSNHQGVRFRSSGDPVLYLSNPKGIDRASRRRMLDTLSRLNGQQADWFDDPEISARIAQYEMAFRMQTAVPELTDFADEPEETFKLYGEDARRKGTFAANCLMARRLAERGVRCIQLYHRGWDQHYNLPSDIRLQCGDVDQPCAALLVDLKRRGLLKDTIVVWGGEFGRTVYGQGKLYQEDYGRDHHGRCFSMWLSGGGIRGGLTYGQTDDFSFNVVQNPVHVHDLNATLLRCLGVDHEKLVYHFQGRDYRLTDVHGTPQNAIISG